MPRLYVKRGKRRDTYWTILAGKYHGSSATKSKGTWRGGFAKKQKAAPQYRPASHHVDTPIELCFESHIREKLRSLE